MVEYSRKERCLLSKITIDFVQCHCHSCGSRRDAHSRVDKLVAKAKANGQKAVALTDHGVLHMIPELFRECGKQGIKPIAGNEMYFAPDGRGGKGKHYHQVVLVKNQRGWHNLLKLTSEAFLTGFHGKPRIDWELLQKHSEGLILTSSCLAGLIPQAILKGDYSEAEKLAKRFVSIMGDDYYLEIQATNTPEQTMVNKHIQKMAEKLDIPVIVTGDVHYVEKEDVKAHLGMLCLGRNQKMHEVKGYDGEENYYLKDGKQIYIDLKAQGFEQDFIVEAMNNTGKIADSVDFNLVKEKDHLPAFPLAEGMTPDQLIGQMVKEGLMRKVAKPTKKYVDRIQFELKVIREKGYQDYFLIVADAIKKGKELGIMFAPARGSGAGSLVSYLIDITEVDPLRHKLFFERFLDITRAKMPDIDTDIEDERRYELIDYLIEKYGERRVAQIANIVRMSPKSAFKNALMVYDIPFAPAQEITGMIDSDTSTIEEAYKLSPELKNMRKKKIKDNRGQMIPCSEIFDMAERFEGIISSTSKHAGGVLITPSDIDDYFPIFKASVDDHYNVVQWDKDDVEALGGVKFDFLGLSTLRTIGLALRSIEREYGKKIDINEIYRGEMDDPAVYERIQAGKTENSFQLSSSGMQELCKAVKPTQFEHIVAINALYRPPALASGDTWRYARIKNGQEEEYYSHPEEKGITGDTFGVITYQEHVMQLVHHFAGWSFGKGDTLRKKSTEQLEAMREEFLSDCTGKGYDLKAMNEIWDRIIRYMGYGFNKSHGVSYSMIAYLTVWLEAHYPEHWKSAIMTTKMGEQDKIAQVFSEIKKEGFEFQAPDVNKSDAIFTANAGRIVFPLGTIKGVGDSAVTELMAQKPYTSMEDLMERVNKRVVSARAMKPLILAGAFDEMYPEKSRKEILLQYYQLKGEAKKKLAEIEAMEWNDTIQAEHEKELLGVYVTSHPLQKYHFRNWSEYADSDRNALIGGVVTKVKSFKDKNGNRMAFATIDTLEGAREVVVFANVFKKYESLLQKGATLMVEGKKDGEKLLPNKIKELV
ncbi:DNA polymerase III subunit alpha [Bacillus sporothermodurans]|uniref:DNA polymerase III subunit alpha n=1 Tax=Heyndrickxia sporothermodurans TaxID=46224 RepID=UPI00192C23DD|nr:DNA polymerase III subunit alpha [Heyndrickxia sporothermodurans]MBL5872336.1 DNA polymerase III subunit alpha [Heyndrickxia sporothermodurans]